jgi:type II secretory ATPase GspE/PulE/Tfp pilus assembly ATPase PilB-like protein
MKVEPFLIPVSLNLMIAQRLVGQICPDCKFQEEPSAELRKIITHSFEGIDPKVAAKYPEPYKVWHTKGCATCKGKGIIDRTPIYEVFRMTPALEDIIASGVVTTQKIMAEAKRQGMITLRQDGIMKALDGITLIEEVIRETEEG